MNNLKTKALSIFALSALSFSAYAADYTTYTIDEDGNLSAETVEVLSTDYYEETVSTTGNGGAAICNTSEDAMSVDANFINCTTTRTGATSTYGGGAVFNGASANLTIIGDFVGNTTLGGNGTSYNFGGAAIANRGTLTVTGDFVNNSTTAHSSCGGGAIRNTGTMYITGNFISNSSAGGNKSSNVGGGAVYNSDTAYITGSFINNSTSTNNTKTVYGGAIYNDTAGTVNLDASDRNMFFTGNTASGSSDAIYNLGVMNFSSTGDYKIVVNDVVGGITDGSETGLLNITSGTTEFNNAVSNQTITVSKYATLSLGSYAGTSDLLGDNSGISVAASSASISSSTINLLEGSTLVIAADTTISFTDVIWNIASAADEVSAIAVMSLSSEEVADAYLANAVIDLSSVSDLSSFEIDLSFDNDADATLFNALLTDGGEIDFTFDGETVVTATYDSSTDSYVLEDGDYSASFNMSTSGTSITVIGTAAVPEPSTYAMIFGVVALGFAAYRRRK